MTHPTPASNVGPSSQRFIPVHSPTHPGTLPGQTGTTSRDRSLPCLTRPLAHLAIDLPPPSPIFLRCHSTAVSTAPHRRPESAGATLVPRPSRASPLQMVASYRLHRTLARCTAAMTRTPRLWRAEPHSMRAVPLQVRRCTSQATRASAAGCAGGVAVGAQRRS
jgi:hypothetical protein